MLGGAKNILGVVNAYETRARGEIGLTGVVGALTSAAHHTTRVRVRELPISIEDLLAAETDFSMSSLCSKLEIRSRHIRLLLELAQGFYFAGA
jgi:hypothetical protein